MQSIRIAIRIITLAAFACLPQFASAKPQSVSLNIPTMDCATCPLTIKAALKKVPGVSQAKVSYEKREAVIMFDDSKTNVDELKKATAEAGYPALVKDSAR